MKRPAGQRTFNFHPLGADCGTRSRQRSSGRLCALTMVALCTMCCGCAALTNPVAQGIPACELPADLLAEPREPKQTIPLSWLRRESEQEYCLAPGDVLGVYIDGVLGEQGQLPPVVVPDIADLPPAVGYPIPVRRNGSISLPLIAPIPVQGMTLEQVEQAIINAYAVQRQIVRPDRERILVSLLQPRHERILVIREDSPRESFRVLNAGRLSNARGLGGVESTFQNQRQGNGTIVDLPAYENDVLNALTRTGGLPGPDAVSEVVIERRGFGPGTPGGLPAGANRVVRIPLRHFPGEPRPFSSEDVTLYSGDIVFIEARNAEYFYTAGLLPAQEVPLPRDYDLNVVEAVTRVGGPILNGGLNSSNLTGAIVAPGIGNPSPSLLTILRRSPDGRQVNIRVDLNLALREPRENILVQAGDVLILQETPGEALARYAADVFSIDIFAQLINRGGAQGNASVILP